MQQLIEVLKSRAEDRETSEQDVLHLVQAIAILINIERNKPPEKKEKKNSKKK